MADLVTLRHRKTGEMRQAGAEPGLDDTSIVVVFADWIPGRTQFFDRVTGDLRNDPALPLWLAAWVLDVATLPGEK